MLALAVVVTKPGHAQTTSDRLPLMQQEVLTHPDNLDLGYQYSQALILAGNFDEAAAELERLLIIDPNQPRLRTELGLVYFRLGLYNLAYSNLRQIVLDPELTPAQRERIQSYLDAAERRLGRSQFGGSVAFGLRFQSNANGGSETALATSSLGPVLLPPYLQQRSDINVFLNGDVVHTYDLDLQRPAVIETHVAGYATRQTSPNFYNFLGMTLRTGVRFAVAPELIPSLSLYPYALTDLVLLNDSFYNFAGGSGLEVSVNPSKALNVALISEFKGAHYDDAPRVPGSSAFSGNQTLVLLRTTYRATPLLELLAQAGGTFVNTKTVYDTYAGFEATVGASFAYSVPAALGGSTWNLLGSATYLRRQYAGPNLAVDLTQTRREQEWIMRLSNEIPVFEHWSAYQSFEYRTNIANVSNYDRINAIATLGISRRF